MIRVMKMFATTEALRVAYKCQGVRDSDVHVRTLGHMRVFLGIIFQRLLLQSCWNRKWPAFPHSSRMEDSFEPYMQELPVITGTRRKNARPVVHKRQLVRFSVEFDMPRELYMHY
jgi:hypothetical protein